MKNKTPFNRPCTFSRLVFVCCAAVLLFCARPLRAQEAAPDNNSSSESPTETMPAGTAALEAIPSGEITSIEVIGLKRTKPHVARYMLERFIGQDAALLDLNDVYAVVKDSGVLEPVSAELVPAEEGLVLRVTVTEKWSIIPFPLVMAGSGGTSFGLFVLDTNAFGQRDQAAVGGVYGSSGWMAMAMYNHTPNRNSLFGWNTSFMYSRQEKENEDRDEKVQRRYFPNSLRFSAGLYFPFDDHITVFAGAGFSKITLVDNAKSFFQPGDGIIPGTSMFLSVTPGFAVRGSDWDGYLLSQRSLSLGYSFNFALEGSSYHQAALKAVYEKSLVPGFRFTAKSGAVWKYGDNPLVENGPGEALVDILPRNFSARHYAGFSAGLEKHLVQTRMGTLSILGAWQCVFSRGPIAGDEFDHGPSGGVRFYLSRLALPAMGFTVAYNMNSGLVQFGFNVGMEF